MLPHRIAGFRSEPGGAPRGRVGGVLERVVERRELRRRPVQRRGGQPVGEPGVLGQQRAVEVGADDRAVRPPRTPSKPERPSLPWPFRTRPSGRSPAPSRVRPPWFSKPARTRGRAVEVDLDRDVADQPRAVLAHRLEVDEADAREPLAAELVAVAEQLVAAADGEDHLAARGRGVQRVALDGGEVLGAQRLVAVLAAADVEEVVRVGVERRRRGRRRRARSRGRATRSAARSSSRLPRSA